MTPVRMGAPGLPDADDADTCIKEEIILEPAGVVLHVIDVKSLPGARYAYIAGVKEDTLAAIASLGLDFEELGDHQIEHGDLEVFDAIVVGPKAYNLREALSANAHRLLDYVDKGGVLIVQYQWYGYEHRGLAPFPFKYNQPMDRVTDENAPVEFLCKQDGIFHFPNRITPEDFAGWSHDRGLAFLREWDSRYKTYLSCSDPGEKNLAGGLVGCRYGQGFYYYVGYSLFRQLPLGVPGAFRLLSNLLAAGHGLKP